MRGKKGNFLWKRVGKIFLFLALTRLSHVFSIESVCPSFKLSAARLETAISCTNVSTYQTLEHCLKWIPILAVLNRKLLFWYWGRIHPDHPQLCDAIFFYIQHSVIFFAKSKFTGSESKINFVNAIFSSLICSSYCTALTWISFWNCDEQQKSPNEPKKKLNKGNNQSCSASTPNYLFDLTDILLRKANNGSCCTPTVLLSLYYRR